LSAGSRCSLKACSGSLQLLPHPLELVRSLPHHRVGHKSKALETVEGRETYEDRLGEAGVGVRYVGGDEIKDTKEEENVSKCGVGGLEYLREITSKKPMSPYLLKNVPSIAVLTVKSFVPEAMHMKHPRSFNTIVVFSPL
jgi:hypothetical protein